MVSRTDAIPMAGTCLRLSRLGARHHGRLSLCHHPIPRDERLARHDRKRGYRLLRRHRAQHFHDWLGARRTNLRAHRRSLWPGQDNGHHDSDLRFVYRSVRHRRKLVRIGCLPFFDGVRNRWRVGCRRCANRRKLACEIARQGSRHYASLGRHRIFFSYRVISFRRSLRLALGFCSRCPAGDRRLLHSLVA